MECRVIIEYVIQVNWTKLVFAIFLKMFPRKMQNIYSAILLRLS